MKRMMQSRRASLTLAFTLIAGLCGDATRSLAATGMERCQAAKIKAGGKGAFDTAKCEQKALEKSLPLDDECMQKASEKLDKAIAKADAIAWCPGSENEIEAAVAACVGGLLGKVFGAPTTTTTTSTTTTTLPCGATVGGFCWYLGAFGADCNTTCADAGKVYHPATATYAGSGGIGANCAAVFAAYGWGFDASYSGGGGVGCATHLGIPPVNFRDTDPTTPTASDPLISRFCACQ